MSNSGLNATLIHRADLNGRLAIVRVQPDQGPLPTFIPGQFCTLGLPRLDEDVQGPRSKVQGSVSKVQGLGGTSGGNSGGNSGGDPLPASPASGRGEITSGGRVRLVRRAYSIASDMRERGYWELLVVLVQGGKLTPRLWTVPEGGRLFLDGQIGGQFTLESVPADRDVVMVATGTGLGPFVSMIRSYAGAGRWRRLALVHGVREPGDLAYREELESLAKRDPSLIYLPTVSQAANSVGWSGLRGRVQTVLEPATFVRLTGWALDPHQAHVLLCGNPAMVQDVQHQLQPLGFLADPPQQPPNLHFERYW